MSKQIKKVIKIIVLGVLVFLLLKKINWLDVWNNFKSAKIEYIILYIILYFAGILISARKWQVLAQFKKFHKPYFFYLKTYLLGTFLNNFFPSFVGGDSYRIYALGKKKKRIGDSSTTIIIDRISGLMAVVFLAGSFGLLNFKIIFHNQFVLWLVFIMAIISTVFLLGIYYFDSRIVQKTTSYLPVKLNNYIKKLGQFKEKNIFIKTINYSFFFVFIGIALANYILFLSLGVHLSLLDFLSVAFLTNIIASIPISIGNVGVKEWAYIFLFGLFGVSASVSVTVVILARVLQMLVSFTALPFYLSYKKTKK